MRKILFATIILLWFSGVQAECRFLSEPAECMAEAEQGNAIAQFVLGFMYENGEGVAQNYQQAANWYHKAAEQGDPDAQYNLGELYSDARSGPLQDDVMSYMWFSIASANGDKEATLQKERMAKKMTPEQLLEAQQQTKGWMADH